MKTNLVDEAVRQQVVERTQIFVVYLVDWCFLGAVEELLVDRVVFFLAASLFFFFHRARVSL